VMNATLPSTRPAIITSILFSYSQVHDTNAGIASQPRTVEVDDGWRPPPQHIVPNAPDCGASTTQPLAFTCTDYPFVSEERGGAQRFLERAELTDAEREAVAFRNWEAMCAGIRR
jgi:hypothetical protein